MTAAPFSIDPLTPAIGAEIAGLDLSRPLDGETLDAVYQALLDRLVIFFRDQDLEPAAQLAFAEGYPNVVLLKHGPDRKPDTNAWHSDLTFYAEPPFASILYAVEVPACGGDTLWANMYAAYDALAPEIKSHIDALEAIHDMGDFRNDFLADGGLEGLDRAMARQGSAVHPVAPRHPVTGRRYLFVNRPFTRLITTMNQRDSDRLLGFLYDHIDRPEFQMRLRWRPGSLAMWDNRVTQHYAVDDYRPHGRTMHRVTVVRDRRAEAGWRRAG